MIRVLHFFVFSLDMIVNIIQMTDVKFKLQMIDAKLK